MLRVMAGLVRAIPVRKAPASRAGMAATRTAMTTSGDDGQGTLAASALTQTRTHGTLAHPSTSAFSSTACISTLAPAVAQSGLMSSASLWLIPSTQGVKIIEVGATRAM